MMIYLCCGIAFSPFANPVQIGNISTPFVWGCFIYCCLNTLIAYGSYGEALNLWDTSKVSVVTTMIPIFTMLFSILGHVIFPETFASLDELDKLCGGNCSRTWCDDGSGRAQNLWKIEIKKWLAIRLLAILGGLHLSLIHI